VVDLSAREQLRCVGFIRSPYVHSSQPRPTRRGQATCRHPPNSTKHVNGLPKGRKLEEAGQFGEALAVFQSVGRVKMTPQVRFHIALCQMHTDKPAEALTNFRMAVKEAGATAPTVVAEAKTHIAKLETRVAVVTVDVLRNESTLSVMFDERIVTPGEQFDADPGDHHVTLQRAGQTVDERRVTIRAGERLRIVLSADPSTNSMSGGQVASIVAFSVAGASVVGLSVFAFLRGERLAELEAACPSFTGCDPSLEPVVREGKTYSAAVNVFAGIAGAAAATGVVLYVVSRNASSRSQSKHVDVRALPMVGPGSAFVTVQGRF
jgi:hypothetical protein